MLEPRAARAIRTWTAFGHRTQVTAEGASRESRAADAARSAGRAPRRRPGEGPRRPRVHPGGVPRRPPAGVGEGTSGESARRPTSRSTETTSSRSTATVLLRDLAIALDLRRDGRTQAQAPHRDLLGQLIEAVLDGSVEVADRLEQAERNEGRNCRWRGHGRSAGT